MGLLGALTFLASGRLLWSAPLSGMESKKSVDPDQMLSRKEVAALLAISTDLVDDAIARQELPAFKLGRAVRLRRRDVVRWATSRPLR